MKIFFSVLFAVCTLSSVAQKNKEKEIYYVYDSDWKPCAIETAKYLAVVEKLNDTAFQWKNYNFTGSLINIETYRDESATIPNGLLAYYRTDGQIDSAGYALNGKKDSTWYFYDDTVAIWMKKDYKNGVLVNTTDFNEKRKEDAKAGIKPPDLEPGEIEADFNGGIKAWIKYLENNYQFPDRALQLGKKGQVKIGFAVDITGKPIDLRILKSVEFSLDKEALRLIEQSPRWKPAVQKGKKVKAFRIQPITFA
jgi:periplasmic protein TonB